MPTTLGETGYEMDRAKVEELTKQNYNLRVICKLLLMRIQLDLPEEDGIYKIIGKTLEKLPPLSEATKIEKITYEENKKS